MDISDLLSPKNQGLGINVMISNQGALPVGSSLMIGSDFDESVNL